MWPNGVPRACGSSSGSSSGSDHSPQSQSQSPAPGPGPGAGAGPLPLPQKGSRKFQKQKVTEQSRKKVETVTDFATNFTMICSHAVNDDSHCIFVVVRTVTRTESEEKKQKFIVLSRYE